MFPGQSQKLPNWPQHNHIGAIMNHLGRNLLPTWPILAHLCPNFAKKIHPIASCTRRSAPRAPEILPAFNFPIFYPFRTPFYFLGGPGVVSGGPGDVRGGSWGALGRPKGPKGPQQTTLSFQETSEPNWEPETGS